MLLPSDSPVPKLQKPDDKSGRLRVLLINDTSRNGGPGKTLLDIVKFLDPARVHRAVLVPRAGIVSERLLENRAAHWRRSSILRWQRERFTTHRVPVI